MARSRQSKTSRITSYFHNAIGVSADAVFILQREGTIEEIGEALKAVGDCVCAERAGTIQSAGWQRIVYRGVKGQSLCRTPAERNLADVEASIKWTQAFLAKL